MNWKALEIHKLAVIFFIICILVMTERSLKAAIAFANGKRMQWTGKKLSDYLFSFIIWSIKCNDLILSLLD